MKKGKNYYFKVQPLEVFRHVVMAPDKEAWFMQFFTDLGNDDADLAVIPYAAELIAEANKFRKRLSDGGKITAEKRWGSGDS